MITRITYHGWVVIDHRAGQDDKFYIEYVENQQRHRVEVESATAAIDWWEKKIDRKVKLLPTPLAAYRVYTEET